MRGVVLHDFFNTIGGGEKVALAIATCLDIEIITTDINLPLSFFSNRKITSIGRTLPIPGIRQTIAAARFNQIQDLDSYDYMVFSGNWAHHAARESIPSLYYCQDAPVRALYDLYPVYLKRQAPIFRPGFMLWATLMRNADKSAISRVSRIVANSGSVKKRVNEYYHRNADLIYPPVDTSAYSYKPHEDFWLSVNRLYPEKRIEIQIEAFSRMPEENLVIVGGIANGDHATQYSQDILKLIHRHANISVKTQGISESDLLDLYSRCKGVICTSHAEAFGMVAIETMASGKPVIAVAEGGYLETITPECGLFINPDPEDLIRAVKKISVYTETFQKTCESRAALFDIQNFNNKMRNEVSMIIEKAQ